MDENEIPVGSILVQNNQLLQKHIIAQSKITIQLLMLK
jgi:hypothetical protein